MPNFRLPSLSPRWTTLLVWGSALVFSALVAANLLARFIASAPVSASFATASDPRAAAQQVAARALMAAGASGDTPLMLAGTSRYKLIGVATGFGDGPGFAMLRQDDGSVLSVGVNDALAPGVRLLRLNADSVDVDYGGRVETVSLVREPKPHQPPPAAYTVVQQPRIR